MNAKISWTSTLIGFVAIAYSSVLSGATFNVANGDVPGLRNAILSANAMAGPDTIILAPGGDYPLDSFYLSSSPGDRTGLPWITSEIVIEGQGATIRRADSIGFPVPYFRIIRMTNTGFLTIRDTLIVKGDLGPGSPDYDAFGASGIQNDGGSLVVENCNFQKNRSDHWVAAIQSTGPTTVSDSSFSESFTGDAGTAGIRATGASSVSIRRCYFFQNNASNTIALNQVPGAEIAGCTLEQCQGTSGEAASGVGIDASGSTAKVINCTITHSGNSAVSVHDGSTVDVRHCTITENGSIAANHNGPGIAVTKGSFLRLVNTIVAFNGVAPYSGDCRNDGVFLLNVGNLIRDGSGSPAFTGDPKLGTLGLYGGGTPVFPLIVGSPAIDHATDAQSEPVDQRGVARPIGLHADIGAYEGSVPDLRGVWRIIVNLIYRTEPYIIVCDPLGGPIYFSIPGTRSLSVRTINPASLTLGNARAGTARITGYADVNRDGVEDLQVTFDAAEVYRGARDCTAVTLLEMQGMTASGQPLVGYINVQAAPSKR